MLGEKRERRLIPWLSDLREKVSATLVIQKNLRKHMERKRNERRERMVEEIEEAPSEL